MGADFARDKNVKKCSFARNREMNRLFVSKRLFEEASLFFADLSNVF